MTGTVHIAEWKCVRCGRVYRAGAPTDPVCGCGSVIQWRGIAFMDRMVAAIGNTDFSAWPPRPIRQDSPFKYVTRRLAKFVPLARGLNLGFSGLSAGHYHTGAPRSGWVLRSRNGRGCWNDRTKPLRCPYGLPGDRLWVRETWAEIDDSDDMKVRRGFAYRADEPAGAAEMEWRPPRFMPRRASRFALEVVDLRVERLLHITHEEALAEGVTGSHWTVHPTLGPCTDDGELPREEYVRGFREMHRLSSDDNPWL